MKILSTKRQTVKILDEYADSKRRKGTIIIHNLPNSVKGNSQQINKDDLKRIDELMEQGTGVSGV